MRKQLLKFVEQNQNARKNLNKWRTL